MAATTVDDIISFVETDCNITISSSGTEPTEADCIRWLNEIVFEVVNLCAQYGSELGRTTGTITLSDGTAQYSDLASDFLAPCIMVDEDGKQFSGWLEKTYSREPLVLVTEAHKVRYDPSNEQEPECFYLDANNYVNFLQTPDDTYTAYIPYYQLKEYSATTSEIGFQKVFDNLLRRSLKMRVMDREEYDLDMEWKWKSFIRDEAKKTILLRRNPNVGVQ